MHTKILIYDDNMEDVIHLKSCIENFFKNKKMKYEIDVCPDSKFLEDNIYSYDFLFLDIELDKENGIQLGKVVKRKHKNCHIFITSKYKKYLIDGYSIKADRYFVKPISQKQFNIDLKNVLLEYYSETISILDSKISRKRIFLKDILYIEYYDRHSVIKLINKEKFITPYPLQYWEKQLNPYFFGRCYRSYIVNCKYVVDVENDHVLLINGEKVFLSRGLKKLFVQKWLESVENSL